MDRLENALREALRRKAPPEGFAERVLARHVAPAPKPGAWEAFRLWFQFPSLRWAAAAALTIVLLAGFQYTAERRRRAQGEAAKEQVLMALRITADKLDYTRAKVQQAANLALLIPRAAGGQTKPANFI
jgi:hypothetical protein